MNEEQAERLIAAVERCAGVRARAIPEVVSECFRVLAAHGAAAAQSSTNFSTYLEGLGGCGTIMSPRNP